MEGRGPLNHPLNPLMVPMGFYNPIIPMVIRQHPASHAYFQSRISTQFFCPLPASGCSPFKYHLLWLLNPQSLPSNEASPGSQKTYWRLSSIKVVTLSSSSLNSKLHSIIKRKKWNFRGLSKRYELANTRLLWNKLAAYLYNCFLLVETKNYANSTKIATLERFKWTNLNWSSQITF